MRRVNEANADMRCLAVKLPAVSEDGATRDVWWCVCFVSPRTHIHGLTRAHLVKIESGLTSLALPNPSTIQLIDLIVRKPPDGARAGPGIPALRVGRQGAEPQDAEQDAGVERGCVGFRLSMERDGSSFCRVLSYALSPSGSHHYHHINQPTTFVLHPTDLQSLVLRFNKGRVLAPSAKNFLMCIQNGEAAWSKDGTSFIAGQTKSVG